MVSLSLPLSPVLPLDLLESLNLPTEPHFYWEKQDVDEAIAAGGCLIQHDVSGSDRFSKAQQISSEWFAQIAVMGHLTTPFSGPHIFCRFTFFDHNEATAPFPSASVFLPQWHVGRHQDQTVFVANIGSGSAAAIKEQCAQLWQRYQYLECVTERLNVPFNRPSSPDSLAPTVHSLSSVARLGLSPAQKVAFSESVNAALLAIEAQDISKTVLAQVLDVSVASPFKIFPSLQTLRHRHPDCHIFSTANAKGQVFLGASPERLLRIRDRTLYTEAIAGSAPRGATPEEDEQLGNTLSCSLKELHEHQLVVNFITKQLAELGLASQRSPFPKLLQLTNIQHLHTPIYASLPSHLSALEILARLHPTPAVAGVPQPLACDIIQQQEQFQRSLYAAPIGWVNYRGDSEFIVGIRSALLDGSTSRLYAGAGIVRGSRPEREVSEIELKFQTLLTALLF
ncbi:MAG: isochorismate synthase [Merismopedia sp. SIO2A8]|nr:isochorismate synthase [Merismopedia sp. SIO2A8]